MNLLDLLSTTQARLLSAYLLTSLNLTICISINAATLPSGFAETPLTNGLSAPTAMAIAPDGRIFVCEQGGRLRVIKSGALVAAPFVQLTVDSAGERGLLGIAFDPNFASNQFVYVYYTATTPAIHNRVSRFTASGDVASGGETIILDLNNLSSATNHNGGAVHFGPDGKLYVAVGENANSANSQTLTNLLGKILRINSDGTIPSDNPFFNTATGINRAIWALGLRNPYTFDFQPGTGVMFINDVGQNAFEEINVGQAGANYGWPTCEGPCSNPNFVNPIFAYPHSGGAVTGCAIVGGAFYNPTISQFPSNYTGMYFFADLCSGWIKKLDPSSGNAISDFATGLSSPVDLKVGSDGSLYYLQRGGTNQLIRIQYVAPRITSQPVDLTRTSGQSATFSVTATGNPTLTYQWQRNGSDINGATSTSYTIQSVSAGDNGAQFRAVVTNSSGTATSNAVTLTVTGSSSGSQIAFSQAVFPASEAGGSAAITVTRTGDLSTTATVDYATVNGTALDSSDYTTNVGTLTFAPGEGSKVFSILLTDDLYVEGNESAGLTLSNPTVATLGPQSTSQLMISDNDSNPPTTNPADQADFFVRQNYLDFLNREADPGGLAYWSGQITNCGSNALCIHNRRLDVSAAFFVENEFQETGFFIVRLYRSGMARRPTFMEFTRDRARLAVGPNLDSEKQAHTLEFVQRAEFVSGFPLTQTASEFVDGLIAAVRTASGVDLATRRAELLGEYNLGSTQADSRSRTLRKLIEYPEYRQSEFNGAFVLAQYFSYLRRDPDAGGYQFWLDVLNNRVPNNYRGMVCAFLTSSEYQRRFSSIVTRSDRDCGP